MTCLCRLCTKAWACPRALMLGFSSLTQVRNEPNALITPRESKRERDLWAVHLIRSVVACTLCSLLCLSPPVQSLHFSLPQFPLFPQHQQRAPVCSPLLNRCSHPPNAEPGLAAVPHTEQTGVLLLPFTAGVRSN